jgi:3-oxoacyl-[acyl-carrier protein] reductase
MKLAGHIAVVTGAGRGIGRATALQLANEGAEVVLVSRTAGELESVAREIAAAGGSAWVHRADLVKDDEVRDLFCEVKAKYGKLSILVNNAGIGRFGRVADLSLEDLDSMWRLNLRAVFHCTQAAIPLLRKTAGTVVQIASLAGRNAFVGGGAYAATKWALIGFSRCLMLEERQYGIRVITVCPGSVDTAFSSTPRDRERLQKILSPVDVAQALMSALLLPGRAMMSEIDLRPTNP